MWGSRCWWESFFTLNIVAVSPCLQASHKHIFNYCNKKTLLVSVALSLCQKKANHINQNCWSDLHTSVLSLSSFPTSCIFLVFKPSSLTPLSFPLLYNSPGMPLLAAFPSLLLFPLSWDTAHSQSLSPPSHVFSLSLIGGSLVLIVFSQGKSHRRVVQSYNPPMTLPLFPITALQDSLCTESTHSQYTTMQPCSNRKTQITHAHTLYQRLISQQHVCVCNRAKQREHIYLFVFIPCWLWATL